MDHKQALSKLKALDAEGAAELASVLETAIEGLEAKNFTVIGEKRQASQRTQALETALAGIGAALGVDGDLEAVLAQAQAKAAEIKGQLTSLSTEKANLETRATEAETKAKTLERQGKIADIAAKTQAAVGVLEKLFGDRIDDLIIDGESVKVGDVDLKAYVEAEPDLKIFAPALFPPAAPATSATAPPPATAKLPPGGTGAPAAGDPVAAYMGSAYGGLAALTAAPAK